MQLSILKCPEKIMESQIDKFNARARKRKEILEQRKQQQQAASHESAEDEQKRKQRE